jgi:hypothetical protein
LIESRLLQQPALVVAGCAAVIALLSLIVTIVQLRATQTHNRNLSVLPIGHGLEKIRGLSGRDAGYDSQLRHRTVVCRR